MKVKSLKENKDGSALVTLDMTQEENRILVEYAVVNLLKEHVEREEKKQSAK